MRRFLTALLAAGMITIGATPVSAQPQDWPARLGALKGDNWRAAFAAAQDLAALPPEEGFGLLREHWPRLAPGDKQQMLKGFMLTTPYPLHFRAHERTIDVLDLGAQDTNPTVQEWAHNYLSDIAFRDFAGEPALYPTWLASVKGKPLEEVISADARRAVTVLIPLEGDALTPALRPLHKSLSTLRDYDPARLSVMEAGFLPLAEDWLTDPATPDPAAEMSLELLGRLQPQEPYMRRVVLPVALEGPSTARQAAAVAALADPACAWAVDALLELATACLTDREKFDHLLLVVSGTLGRIGDPRAIPILIAIVAADNTERTISGIGGGALARLTGEKYEAAHDGAWWNQWWKVNGGRYPKAGELPDLKVTFARGDTDPLTVAGNPDMRYFLYGPSAGAAPEGGWKLLLVLPGGDGSADFRGFVEHLATSAVPPGFIVAQLIAPQWTDDENRIVWPTVKLPDPRMKFPTEDFIAAVAKDVQNAHPIDSRHVYALGWSSGGPPVYAASVTPGSPLTGCFVAMSVFKPQTMPPLDAAKGKAYYILHSPEDFIQMRFPEAAMAQLTAAGAATKLEKYSGGHGWYGDVDAMVRAGLEWLAAHS